MKLDLGTVSERDMDILFMNAFRRNYYSKGVFKTEGIGSIEEVIL